MKFKDLLECMSKIMKEVQLIIVVTEVYGMQFSSTDIIQDGVETKNCYVKR